MASSVHKQIIATFLKPVITFL